MDIERASNIINAFPHISKTIVDDTLYEKVLSYLTLVVSTIEVTKLNEKSNIFKSIQKACLEIKDQDYRVTTLCIRFMGQVIYYGKDTLFLHLQQDFPNLLLLVTNGIRSSEGSLRCASIETCRLFLQSSLAQHWLLNNKNATYFITYALLDQSNYVVQEACQLFSTLLKLNQQEILSVMDPSSLILTIIQNPEGDEKQIISALDFCWQLVNIKETNALEYIRENKLFYPMMQLLCSKDRIIRSRVLEILSILFNWDNDPLQTLGLKDTDNQESIETAYKKIMYISKTMILQSNRMDDLITAISLLDISLILLQRLNQHNQLPIDILFALFDACLLDQCNQEYINLKNLLKTNRIKNNVLQLILKSMNKLVSMYGNIITKDHHFIEIFNLLNNELFYSDPRVLKSCLNLLSTSLYQQEQPVLLKNTILSLVNMLEESDCKNLVIILDSFNHLLNHDQIGTILTDHSVSKNFVNVLTNKLFDTEWNIRDVVINFIGNLFTQHEIKIQFALNFDLPLQAIERIADTEPYVQASVLQVLTNMIQCDKGWYYIQQHDTIKELIDKLPIFLYHDEAFVRRAALDTIISLLQYRSGQGLNFETNNNHDKSILSPNSMQRIINDQDSDVRIRGCTLIEKLWIIYNQQTQQRKKHNQQKPNFFESIHATKLLTECALDINRVVRIEAYRVIQNILNYYKEDQSKKRQFDEKNDFTIQFLTQLSNLDLIRLKDSLNPEHLYQEAFDINPDMMTKSIVPNDPNDDINMLDCY